MSTDNGNASDWGGVVGVVDGLTSSTTRLAPTPRIETRLDNNSNGCHSTTPSFAVSVDSPPFHVTRAKRIVDATEPDTPSTDRRPPLGATMRATMNGKPDSDARNATLA